jgi:hypothetical protein
VVIPGVPPSGWAAGDFGRTVRLSCIAWGRRGSSVPRIEGELFCRARCARRRASPTFSEVSFMRSEGFDPEATFVNEASSSSAN